MAVPASDEAVEAAKAELFKRGIVDVFSVRAALNAAARIATLERAETAVAAAEARLANCNWYWPEDDTSSETCAGNPFEVLQNMDAPAGEVVAVSRGGVVETRYYAWLPPADDATTDAEFEVDEATEESAAAKIAAERRRRLFL
jgi:hypothetical protein